MKQARAMGDLRALCRLALPGEQLVPAVLEALHRIVPSYRNLFDWTDAQGRLERYWFEGPIDHRLARRYFETYHNAAEAEPMGCFSEVVLGRARLRSAAELDTAAFFGSALYNEIWRPQGLHTRVEAIVRRRDGVPLGSLVLYRGKGERPFTRSDEQLLDRVARYVAEGLVGEGRSPGDYVDSRRQTGLVILSAAGDLLQVSPRAHELLMLANGGLTPKRASAPPHAEDCPALRALRQALARSADVSRPVHLSVHNAWGRFRFEAQRLEPVAGSAPVVHVAISRDEARAVVVRRAISTLPLSVAQSEVLALMHAGRTWAEIAQLIDVAPSTVADHARSIFRKLDVHSRLAAKELVDRLIDLSTRGSVTPDTPGGWGEVPR